MNKMTSVESGSRVPNEILSPITKEENREVVNEMESKYINERDALKVCCSICCCLCCAPVMYCSFSLSLSFSLTLPLFLLLSLFLFLCC